MMIVQQNRRPSKYFEEVIMMLPSDMQDEINQLFLKGMKLSVIEDKVGIVAKDYKRIYDFKTNQIIVRFRIL